MYSNVSLIVYPADIRGPEQVIVLNTVSSTVWVHHARSAGVYSENCTQLPLLPDDNMTYAFGWVLFVALLGLPQFSFSVFLVLFSDFFPHFVFLLSFFLLFC